MNKPFSNVSLFCIFFAFNLYTAEKSPAKSLPRAQNYADSSDEELEKLLEELAATTLSPENRLLKTHVMQACTSSITSITKEAKKNIYNLMYQPAGERKVEPNNLNVSMSTTIGSRTYPLLVASTLFCKDDDITRILTDGHSESDAKILYEALAAAKQKEKVDLITFFSKRLSAYGFNPESNPFDKRTS